MEKPNKTKTKNLDW